MYEQICWIDDSMHVSYGALSIGMIIIVSLQSGQQANLVCDNGCY